jgi:hypothetical protein
LNFEVNQQLYFLDLSEDARQWLVFVETPAGMRPVPVYVDVPTSDVPPVLIEDRHGSKLVN